MRRDLFNCANIASSKRTCRPLLSRTQKNFDKYLAAVHQRIISLSIRYNAHSHVSPPYSVRWSLVSQRGCGTILPWFLIRADSGGNAAFDCLGAAKFAVRVNLFYSALLQVTSVKPVINVRLAFHYCRFVIACHEGSFYSAHLQSIGYVVWRLQYSLLNGKVKDCGDEELLNRFKRVQQ